MTSQPNKPDTITQAQAAVESCRVLRCLFFLVFHSEPRSVDLAAVTLMSDSCTTTDEAQEVAANYVWDHHMGEPEDVEVDDLLEVYRELLHIFTHTESPSQPDKQSGPAKEH